MAGLAAATAGPHACQSPAAGQEWSPGEQDQGVCGLGFRVLRAVPNPELPCRACIVLMDVVWADPDRNLANGARLGSLGAAVALPAFASAALRESPAGSRTLPGGHRAGCALHAASRRTH